MLNKVIDFPRPKPDVDDRATSDRIRQLDQRTRQYIAWCKDNAKAKVSERRSRRRSNGALLKSPYPAAVPNRGSEVGDDQQVNSDDDRAALIRESRNTFEIERLKKGYRRDVESRESAVEEDEEGGGDKKQDSANPFADPTSDIGSDSDDTGSWRTVATSDIEPKSGLSDAEDPFDDSHAIDEDHLSSASSGWIVLSSGQSEDKIRQHDPPQPCEAAIQVAKTRVAELLRTARWPAGARTEREECAVASA